MLFIVLAGVVLFAAVRAFDALLYSFSVQGRKWRCWSPVDSSSRRIHRLPSCCTFVVLLGPLDVFSSTLFVRSEFFFIFRCHARYPRSRRCSLRVGAYLDARSCRECTTVLTLRHLLLQRCPPLLRCQFCRIVADVVATVPYSRLQLFLAVVGDDFDGVGARAFVVGFVRGASCCRL